MKIFHLSDLHVGKTVCGFSMLEDQIYIFAQILEYVKTEKPDAVIIAGDVYDKPSPGADAVRVFDGFLTALAKESKNVFIISGNHDSPERLEFASRIMSESGVYVYGSYDGSIRTVTMGDGFGDVVFHMLPFVRPSAARRFFGIDSASFDDTVRLALEAHEADFSKRNIIIAHQFFVRPGTEPELSESEAGPVGGIDAVDSGLLSKFDYAALGHLHAPQRAGYEHIRYAGSPLKYSASEHRHKKAILLVELGSKGSIKVSPLPLIPLRDMRKIKGPIEMLISPETILPESAGDYMHVTLTDEDEIIDAIGKLRSVYPNVMSLSFDNTRTKASADYGAVEDVEVITDIELFEKFFELQNGIRMKERQAEAVVELLERTEEAL